MVIAIGKLSAFEAAAPPVMIPKRTLLPCLFPLLLAGCAQPPRSAPAVNTVAYFVPEEWLQRWGEGGPQQEHDEVRKAAAAMLEGIRLYDNGEFDTAIAKLSEPEIRTAPGPIRVEALKYVAFSYCVTRDLADCRHAFDMALSIDPDFALGRGEGGHPMWGPVFEQAKGASEQHRVRASLAHARERWREPAPWRPW